METQLIVHEMNGLPLAYFEEDGFSLYHGDSPELLSRMPEESVDLIFADPPYNLSNGGFTCQNGRRAPVNKGAWDESRGISEDFSFHRKWIDACRRVLKESGTLWISGTYHSIYACGYALQLSGFHILNDICWYKPNAPPNLSTRYFTASHETLIWARKGEKAVHCFNYSDMKCGDWPSDSLKTPDKQMRTVWSIPSARRKEKETGRHPTQKPCSLLIRVLRSSSNRGDLILDPFTGSSTTGLAAYYLGRKFIGIDREESFLALSERRFQELSERMKA
jgi:site-specific DNA-methyltransferase (adenine-specific)